jgi:hypothetical protein
VIENFIEFGVGRASVDDDAARQMSRKQIAHAAHGSWRPKACCFLDFWTYTRAALSRCRLGMGASTVARVGAIQPAKNIEFVIFNKTGSVIAVRSAQDDSHAARSPAPSLRHHRKPERQLALQTQEDDYALTALAISPQLHRQDSSQSRSKLKTTNRLTDELACFGAIRRARVAAICASTNRTLKVFSPYFAITKPAQQLGLVSKFPLL